MTLTTSSERNQLDVLILGGGPAGMSAGLALLKRGDLKVGMIERGDFSDARFGESLASTARSSLEYLGAWDAFAQTQSLAPSNTKLAWGNLSMRAAEEVMPAVGPAWALDRVGFEQSLADIFVRRGGELLINSQVVTCEPQAKKGWKVQVKLQDKSMLTVFCKFVIDASGRRGVMRTNLNIPLTVHDRLVGVGCIGVVAEGSAVSVETQIEACEYGWWHISKMADNQVSVVLMSDPDILSKLHASQSDVWRALLEKMPHLGQLSHEIFFAEPPRSFACYSSYLQGGGGKDWVAIGDAAASFDPISGRGIPRAIAGGVHGAFIAVDSIYSSGALLETYAQAIAQDFRQYLQTQWQIYQRETRWPDAAFWARRRAVVGISTDSVIKSCQYYEAKFDAPALHLRANEIQELWLLCREGRSLKEVVQEFLGMHRQVPEQKVVLGLQELIERAYVEISVDEGEDCVFFNTERLIFD